MGGIGIWQLVIVAVIVVLLFGTKKLRGLGGDLGSAIKGFKNALGDEKQADANIADKQDDSDFTDKKVESVTENKEKDQAK